MFFDFQSFGSIFVSYRYIAKEGIGRFEPAKKLLLTHRCQSFLSFTYSTIKKLLDDHFMHKRVVSRVLN